MVLRGVLDYSFNNILCLRGFAPLPDLAKMSVTDENYQRKEIPTHSADITTFLDSGDYTFFPEVILGGSFEKMGVSWKDIDDFYDAFNSHSAFRSKKTCKVGISIAVKTYSRENGVDFHLTGSFSRLRDATFSRIDGNHRLQAVEQATTEKVKKYNTPFCLVLFRTEEECRRFGRVFFHMINFRAEPISENQNLKLILEENDFSDEKLLHSPFGLDFAIARMCLRCGIFHAGEQKISLSHSMLRKMIQHLLGQDNAYAVTDDDNTKALQEKATSFFKKFQQCVEHIHQVLATNTTLKDLCDTHETILAAMISVAFSCESAFSEFLAWLTIGERCQDIKRMNIPFDNIIAMFDMGREERHKTIFVSMQFGSCGTEQNFNTIKTVVEQLNKQFNLKPKLKIVRVDQVVTGETFEINEKVINEIAQCGYLIADLTYCNSNVYHEIGMLMGRTLALTGKHEYNMTLILDKQVSQEHKIVKFNLQSLQHLEFSSRKTLANEIRKRLECFYKL